jgi:hypothetical protein
MTRALRWKSVRVPEKPHRIEAISSTSNSGGSHSAGTPRHGSGEISDRHSLTSEGKYLFWVGVAVLSIGLVCSEGVLKKLFSADGVLELETRVIIGFFNFVLISLGIGLIKYKKLINFLASLLGFGLLHPRFASLFFGVAFSGALLLAVEGLFYAISINKDRLAERTWYNEEQLTEADEILGYKHLPNVQVSSKYKFNNKIIYEDIYTDNQDYN